MVPGLVGHRKGVGAMGSYWKRNLSGSWQRGGDMFLFLIRKDDFGSCIESILEGERSEQQGDLLRGNCRNSG